MSGSILKSVAQALVWILGVSGCQPSAPCSEDELRRAVAQVEQLHETHPLTVGYSVGHDDVARSIRAACPAFPVWIGAPMDLQVDADTRSRHRAASLETCPGLAVALTNHRKSPSEFFGAFPPPAYAVCDLQRFDLADAARFALSDDGFHAFVAYDQMLRRGADPELASVLAKELLWQSPWPVSEQLLRRLPIATDVEAGSGVGLRVTTDGITLGTGDERRPLAAIADAMARVQPYFAAEHDGGRMRRLVIVADADVPRETLSRIADAGFVVGADTVHLLATDAFGRSGFAPVPIAPDSLPDPDALSIESVEAAWRKYPDGQAIFGAHARARVGVDVGEDARVLVNTTCREPSIDLAKTTVDGHAIPPSARGGELEVSSKPLLMYDSRGSCQVSMQLVDPSRSPALRDREDRCFAGVDARPAPCRQRLELGPHSWSIEDLQTTADRYRFTLRAGRIAAPQQIVVLTSCPQSRERVVEVQTAFTELQALDPGNEVEISGTARTDNALGLSKCRFVVSGVRPDAAPMVIGTWCVRPGAVEPGECVMTPPAPPVDPTASPVRFDDR